jgi:hypothetical protein
MLYLFVDATGDVDLSWRGNAFKSRSYIDPVAVNVACFEDDVTKIDTYSILNPMVLRQ